MNNFWQQQIEQITRWLGIAILVGLILLIVVQALLQIDWLREWLVPVEKWEGKHLLLHNWSFL